MEMKQYIEPPRVVGTRLEADQFIDLRSEGADELGVTTVEEYEYYLGRISIIIEDITSFSEYLAIPEDFIVCDRCSVVLNYTDSVVLCIKFPELSKIVEANDTEGGVIKFFRN